MVSLLQWVNNSTKNYNNYANLLYELLCILLCFTTPKFDQAKMLRTHLANLLIKSLKNKCSHTLQNEKPQEISSWCSIRYVTCVIKSLCKENLDCWKFSWKWFKTNYTRSWIDYSIGPKPNVNTSVSIEG